jgi:hypothetical protein
MRVPTLESAQGQMRLANSEVVQQVVCWKLDMLVPNSRFGPDYLPVCPENRQLMQILLSMGSPHDLSKIVL